MLDTRKKQRKESRRDVYARHGIIFDGDKIISPVGPVCELLKQGNDKTGKEVWTYSILPGTCEFTAEVNGTVITERGTCCCDCVGCYAKTGHYRQNSAVRSMVINTYLTVHHIEFVRECIAAQLEYIGRGEVRIHAAGDFNTANSDEYADMWHGIAARYTSFRFWTYTKVRRFEGLFDDLKNANIVKSVIPGIGLNFGHCDYIIAAYYTLRELGKSVYICRCGIDKNQHCERCGVCAAYEYVLFLEHSTDYKAEADPLYSKLVELVNNQ
jgi:hypothetical protein